MIINDIKLRDSDTKNCVYIDEGQPLRIPSGYHVVDVGPLFMDWTYGVLHRIRRLWFLMQKIDYYYKPWS